MNHCSSYNVLRHDSLFNWDVIFSYRKNINFVFYYSLFLMCYGLAMLGDCIVGNMERSTRAIEDGLITLQNTYKSLAERRMT